MLCTDAIVLIVPLVLMVLEDDSLESGGGEDTKIADGVVMTVVGPGVPVSTVGPDESISRFGCMDITWSKSSNGCCLVGPWGSMATSWIESGR